MELRADAVIAGKYRLLRPLGQGGMGVVWAAQHLGLDTEVAVKFIRPERVAVDPALLGRFEREARAAARIAHPHVVQMIDYGDVDGVPYIVMERLRGFSLAELLERGGRLSLATAKSLVQQIASALESAHEHGIVHRDIKPHNVFITEGSKGYPLFVKVLDFGVAKTLGETPVPGASALTETGTVIGSPPYMSPEQLEGQSDVDWRSDLWSLGVIVYEVLTGTQPFRGTSFVSVGAAVLKGRYRPACELRSDLPESVDDWLAKALCLDREGRFQSAREMAEAFVAQESPHTELAGNDVSPAAYDTTVVHAPAVTPRRRRSAIIAALVVVAVAVSVVLARPQASGGCPPGMTAIPGATFTMGSADADAPTDEAPRSVTVRSFCIDNTEVTVNAYRECSACERPMTVKIEEASAAAHAFESKFCNGHGTGDHPINCIDWNQAKAYCEAQNKRLPSEEEWELAARGAEGRRYPWGNDEPSAERLNACSAECSAMLTERRKELGKGPWPSIYAGDDGAEWTARVGHYAKGATPAGIFDMAGNVWEWTDSVYESGDSRRVLRGGGWDTIETADVRAARRKPSAATARGRSIGFRCALTP